MTVRAGVLLAMLAIALSGCGADTRQPVESEVTRVVTLAPHLAELMFAIGAGDILVGVSAWSDYPTVVADIPVIGDAFTIDQEQLALLRPDLLLAWESGLPAHTVDELRRAGYRVEVIRTRGLDDVVSAMLRLGELVGRADAARSASTAFESGLDELRRRHGRSSPIRVFYQVSARPLFTVSGEHFLSDLISICGGENVFAGLGELAPGVSDEAVLAADPELMLATDAGDTDTFAEWQRWPRIAANRYGNYFTIDADTSSRPTPRLLHAGREICDALETGRERRSASGQ